MPAAPGPPFAVGDVLVSDRRGLMLSVVYVGNGVVVSEAIAFTNPTGRWVRIHTTADTYDLSDCRRAGEVPR